MKKRIKRWLKHKFVSYIPGTSKLASMEALRLSKYLTENFDTTQQLIIIEELKENIIAFRNAEIINKIEDIELCNRQLESLKVNLGKLCTE
jgi:hypothetical protein